MKTTPRFDAAVSKLYNAFHNGTLNAFDCTACAVGNICSNIGSWSMHYVNGIENGDFPKREYSSFNPPYHKDYCSEELARIEYVFLKEWAISKSIKGTDKEIQFKGLCAVIEYLCKLDNIPNIMDYTRLFETENNQPKYQLA